MSMFNRKGFRAILGRTKDGELKHFPVKIGSDIDIKHQANVMAFKKERTESFREYKRKLKEQKKRVPLSERAKINWTRVPEKYL